MLDTTLATEFIPGTNRRWQVTGANWTFLLPSLELDRVLCIGAPSAPALATLTRVGRTVDIVRLGVGGGAAGDDLPAHENPPARGDSAPKATTQVNTILADDLANLPLAPGTADLILVADDAVAARLDRDPGALAALERLLAPGGRIYWEARVWRPHAGSSTSTAASPAQSARSNGHTSGQEAGVALDEAGSAKGGAGAATGGTSTQRLWLTPLAGEMHTAVPAADRAVVDFFLRNNLYSLSGATLGRQAVGRLRRRVRGGRSKARGSTRGQAGAAVLPGGVGEPVDGTAPASPSTRPTARDLAKGIARMAERSEGWLVGHRLLMPRQGLLAMRGDASSAVGAPPAYLRALAQTAGVDIGAMRWGLSARGAYSSRKVLFFLFESGQPEPGLIVKMTRDGAFNARLENEARGLARLEALGVGDAETLPRVVFSGQHGGLAIVGETVIAGAPFRERARWAADCPYANAAIDWLVELSAKTVGRASEISADVLVATDDGTSGDPAPRSGEAGAALGELLRRFNAIYTLAPQHRDFLEAQVALIARHPGPFPAVFQHGDPGTWNLVATPGGRVAFLDWEAAETRGMPLWDLFYFLRSYSVGAARAGGTGDTLAGFREQWVDESPLGALLAAAVARGREAAGLPAALVEPLFHTCWMHRALKESTRLSPDALDGGHYLNFLRLGIERRDSPGLARILAGR